MTQTYIVHVTVEGRAAHVLFTSEAGEYGKVSIDLPSDIESQIEQATSLGGVFLQIILDEAQPVTQARREIGKIPTGPRQFKPDVTLMSPRACNNVLCHLIGRHTAKCEGERK